MRRLLITTLALVGSAGCFVFTSGEDKPAELVTGDAVKVTEVIKGDEVVIDKKGASGRVRMLGIHAFQDVIDDPEYNAITTAAKSFLESKLIGKEITVEIGPVAQDSRGRYLAFVSLGEEDVGRSMVEAGLASVYTEYPFSREVDYLKVEAEARAKGAVMWGQGKPKKATIGLRKQWAEIRAQKGRGTVTDPLLPAP